MGLLFGMVSPAHPRACGENNCGLAKPAPRRGSSPRMRGKLRSARAANKARGLIPAHAGKTREPGKARSQARAHPRACGENEGTWEGKISGEGSSPRMRGKPPPFDCEPPAPRLIPAHAGKTRAACLRRRPRRAHPRACGENRGDWQAGDAREGSSPRMRGKQPVVSWWNRSAGLIPAHAGKTTTRR